MTKQILNKAIATYGIDSQLNQCVEEMAELIQAINKARRAGIVKSWGIKPPSAESQMNQVEAYNNLCMEIADVVIMLAQLEIMLDTERIELSINRKLKRLESKLNEQKQQNP
jgi:NTP pyrophosphatase (non-canonical NTP hydrolase)